MALYNIKEEVTHDDWLCPKTVSCLKSSSVREFSGSSVFLFLADTRRNCKPIIQTMAVTAMMARSRG
jgi:hypothetical protein